MKYFKHFSDMRHDPKIRRLISKYGLEGYGLYNLIIESIAGSVETNNPLPFLGESCEDIADFYNANSAKVDEMVRFMIQQGLLSIDSPTGKTSCPALMRYIEKPRDERSCPQYIAWRNAIYERDKYTCQQCKQFGGNLNAHHILPWAKYPESRFDIRNGITLCYECHKRAHKGGFRAVV